MAATKKATTKRTGTKTTARRNAGKTSKAPRVTAKSMAADIFRRDNRRAGFWDEVQAEVSELWRREHARTGRIAQVMTREHATQH